jgi:hypothetical protein
VKHVKPNLKFLLQLHKQYLKAHKKERNAILDEFLAATGYHRKHASALLRDKRQWRDPKQPLRRARRDFYTAEDQRAVLWLVELFQDIGPKRFRVAMNNELPNLRRHRHLHASRRFYQHLRQVSASTMEWWRRAARRPGRNRAAPPNRAHYSNAKFRFVPLPNGMINERV